MRHATGTILITMVIAASAGAQSAPQIRLGAPTELPGVEFSRIVDARPLADGRLLVTDAIEKQAYVVDFARQAARKIGRQGAGPGEYRSPGRFLSISADSSLLIDQLGGRWLVMVRDSFVGVVPADAPAMSAGRNPFGADAKGHLLANRPARNLDGAVGNVQITNDSSWLVRVERATGRIDTIGKYRIRPSRIAIQGTSERPTSVSIVMNPISTAELPTICPDGAIAIARLNPYRVDWLIDGRHVAGKPLPFDAIPLTSAEKAAIVAKLPRTDTDTPRNPDDVKDWPEIIPPFVTGSNLAAPDGMLWIRRAPSTRAPGTDYDVVDRTGRLARRLHLAPNEVLLALDRTHLYVSVKDDDDIQRLRRYALPR